MSEYMCGENRGVAECPNLCVAISMFGVPGKWGMKGYFYCIYASHIGNIDVSFGRLLWQDKIKTIVNRNKQKNVDVSIIIFTMKYFLIIIIIIKLFISNQTDDLIYYKCTM